LLLECIRQFVKCLHNGRQEGHVGNREIVHTRELLSLQPALSATVLASAGEASDATAPRSSNNPSFLPSAIVGVTIPPMSI
ncbi:hypothetical protein PMAYCL1PPCAC_32274, partial [Pristionchus mayeri]